MRILNLAFLLLTISLSAQNNPINFESNGNGAQWTWTVFENATNPPLEIVSNPSMTGINTSATVAKITALQAGQPWVGCESQHGADIGSFLLDETNSIVKIKVWKSVISDIGIKLVRADSWSLGEIKVSNTLINEWEEITFDMSSNEGEIYDQIVIFPDFDLAGRTSDNIVYFDDVSFSDGTNVGLDEVENIELSLFPNPVKDQLNITSDYAIRELIVSNLLGEVVMTSDALGLKREVIDLSELSSGSYVIQVHTEAGLAVRSFVK